MRRHAAQRPSAGQAADMGAHQVEHPATLPTALLHSEPGK